MKFGRLGSIVWDKSSPPLSALAAKNPIARMLAETGIPRSPYDRSVRSEAIFLLEAASEIEHSLLVQYLYAWISIDKKNPVASAWGNTILSIAIQEMAHLVTVQNMLLALGAEPYLDRGRLHVESIPFDLAPFDQVPLARFITTESPMPAQIPNAAKRKTTEEIAGIAKSSMGGGGTTVTIQHVGALYVYLYWLMLPTDTPPAAPWPDFPINSDLPKGRHLSEEDFRGLKNPSFANRQTTATEWGMDEGSDFLVFKVLSAKQDDPNSPLVPIFNIALQGEGWDDTAQSHFNKFYAMWKPLQDQISQGKAVALPIATNPSVYPNRPGTRTITNEAAAHWGKLFNARYRMLLLQIWLGLSEPSDAPDTGLASRPELFGGALDQMRTSVTTISRKLVTLPIKPRPAIPPTTPLELAGPPFELPDDTLPDAPKAQAMRLIELIADSGVETAWLLSQPATDPDRPNPVETNFLKDLVASDAELKTALEAFLATLP